MKRHANIERTSIGYHWYLAYPEPGMPARGWAPFRWWAERRIDLAFWRIDHRKKVAERHRLRALRTRRGYTPRSSR